MKIGIVIIATNSYFPLALRFIRKFQHHYRGNTPVKFYLFTDTNPSDYISGDIEFIETHHNSWVDGTNSKFENIKSICTGESNYIAYFDADTNITKDFTEEWFIGDMVGGQHYADQSWMKEKKGFDRNPRSMAYIPEDTPLPQMYFYGAFFAARTFNMINFCNTLIGWQKADREWEYEPGCNDESYINKYFHLTRPTKIVKTQDFQFDISDKGGIEGRDTKLDIEHYKEILRENKDKLFDIRDGKILFI